MTARRPPYPWLKPAVFVGCLGPFAYILFRWWTRDLGPNFIEEILNQFGLLTLIILVASLCCTPLKSSVGWTWPMRIRRMLGLFAFFYASLHLLTYVVLDQQFAWGTLLQDVLKRKFIMVGLGAFLLLVPPAITSTNAWVRRLGHARWARIHQLVYGALILACVHFLWRVKADLREPLTYAALAGLLLSFRVISWAGKQRKSALRTL